MELLSSLLLLIILILGVLTLFAPYYIYSIHKSAKTQIELLRLNLEAQNNIIKILWDTQQQSK